MSDFQNRIDKLQDDLQTISINENININEKSTWCVSYEMMISIAAPIITLLVLYFWSPSFVMSDGKLSWSKVLMYTVGVSVLVWGSVYLYNYCGKCE